jgi:hypothetical protein
VLLLTSTCGGSSSAAAATDASVPTPTSYAATCRLVPSWCKPVPGRIPTTLRRPLHLPALGPGGSCPTSSGHRFFNGQFGGVTLGSGPVRPLISAVGGDKKHGVLAFYRTPDTSPWWTIKTLWFSYPRYQGPVLIRGRRLGRSSKVVFGEDPSLTDPQLPPEPTINGTHGWREWPGGTFVHSFGCYAWQVDGRTFSTVIVFKAVSRRG